MALKVLTTTSNLSTSDGNWLTSLAAKVGFLYNGATSYYDDINTARYMPTSSGTTISGNCVGVYLFLRVGATLGSTTMTVSLEENTGSWVERATSGALTASTILAASSGGIYVPFTAAYNAGGGTFRVKVVSNASGKIYLYRRSGTAATENFYALMSDTSTDKPTSSDTLATAKDVVLTVDESITLAPTDGVSLVVGDNSTFQWDSTPSSAFTLTLGAGHILPSSNSSFIVGDENNRIPYAQKAKITSSLSACLFAWMPDAGIGSLGSKFKLKIYGELPAYSIRGITSQNDNTGQALVHLTENVPANWSNGDILSLSSERSGTDSATYTISSISGSTITLTGNITTYKSVKGGYVINKTLGQTYGVELENTSGAYAPLVYSTSSYCDYYKIDGCYFDSLSLATCDTNTPAYSTEKSELKNIFFDTSVTSGWKLLVYAQNSLPIDSENVYIVPTSSPNGNCILATPNGSFSGLVIKNLSTQNVTLNSLTVINNFCVVNSSSTSSISLSAASSGSTLSNGEVIGACISLGATTGVVFNSVNQSASTRGLFSLTSTGCVFNTCTFGVNVVNSNEDIASLTSAQVVFNNCKLGSATFFQGYLGASSLKGFLKFNDYQQTSGDNRTFLANGYFKSSSGKLQATQETGSGCIGMGTIYPIITGAISGSKIGVTVGTQLTSTLAGLYVLPALKVIYDNGSESTVSASNNTTRQVLSRVVTSSTNNSPLYISLSFTSGENNKTNTWDTLYVNCRKYGYQFYEISKAITYYGTDVIGEISSLIANSFITETTEATVAAYTGITINHSTQKVTIDEAHSLAELYDYSQYDLTLDANMGYSEWLTTDGNTYTSAYDIEVDGVILSGAGKTLNLGSNDFTVVNGGSTTAKVSDVDGTIVPILVSNIPENARILVEKTDHTELFNQEVTGGTLSGTYNWTTDVSINVKVRKGSGTPYYTSWETSGTINNNGFSAVCSPIPDGIATTYDADIPSEWTVVDDTSVNHSSGTDRYTVRELYSWLQDYIDASTKMRYLVPMSAQTRVDFTLINGYTMTDASHEYLKGGSITEASGDTLWSNFYTFGLSPTNLDTPYVEQNDALVTGFWSAGDIDILLKTKTGGALIDSGIATVFARTWGRTFNHYQMDLSGGGRTIAPLSTETDANNATSRTTVAGYTDVDVTFGAVSNYQIDDDDTPGDYGCTIDCNNSAVMTKVYEWCKYLTDEDSTTDLNGVDGMFYRGVDPAYTEVKNCPFGSLVGGTFYGAQGVRLINVPNTDLLKFVLKDNDGVNHQATPAPTALTITNLVAGSTVYIYDQNTSTELVNEVEATTEFTDLYTYPGTDHTMTVKVRKAGYKTFETSAIATSAGLYVIADQEVEPVYASYPAGIATDFSFTGATMAIAHETGTTIYTGRQLFSYLNYLSATTAYMGFDVPMQAKTNFEFALINGATISEADHQYLKTCGIEEAGGDDLWINLYTLGEINASVNVYVVQDGVKLTSTWGAGHIDVLVKVKSGGTLIDSGILEVFAREFNYQYDHSTVSGAEGGRVPVSFTAETDENNQTASGTVATYSDITLTEGDVSKDIGDGQGLKTYKGIIDCAGRTKEQVFEYLKYITRRTSTTQIFSTDGEQFIKIDPAFAEFKNGPLAKIEGDLLVAQGWWIEDIHADDELNYIVIDENGDEHQVPTPPPTISVTNIVAGSRIQVYDLTTDEELANEIVAGTTYSLQKVYTTDLNIRIRLMYYDGTTAKEFWESQNTFTSTGVSFRAEQEDDDVYADNGIVGADVENVTIDDGLLLVAVDAGTITWQQLYAYETYWLSTEEGIRDEGRFAEAVDTANYRWTDFKIKNITDPSVPLVISGGYGVDADTGLGIDMIDTSGGTIFTAPDHVVAKVVTVAGESVITGDITDIPSYVPTANENAQAVIDAGALTEDNFLNLNT